MFNSHSFRIGTRLLVCNINRRSLLEGYSSGGVHAETKCEGNIIWQIIKDSRNTINNDNNGVIALNMTLWPACIIYWWDRKHLSEDFQHATFSLQAFIWAPQSPTNCLSAPSLLNDRDINVIFKVTWKQDRLEMIDWWFKHIFQKCIWSGITGSARRYVLQNERISDFFYKASGLR